MTRGISPDIYRDEWFGQLSRDQRHLWLGLIVTMADDQGRFLNNPLVILRTIFIYDEDLTPAKINTWISEFISDGKLLLYEIEGKKLLQIINWWKYQSSAAWMSASKLTAPTGWVDRVRCHGKDRKIITNNWDMPGGFSKPIPTPLPSDKGKDKGRQEEEEEVKEEVKEKEEEEEEEESPPAPAPATSFSNSSQSQTKPAANKTPSALRENPALQKPPSKIGYTNYEDIYRAVTCLATVPPNIAPQVKLIISSLVNEKKFDNKTAQDYLQPFYAAWCTRTNKDNKPYSKTSIGWLEWALSGDIPQNGNGQHNNKTYTCSPDCEICRGAVHLRDPSLPVGHPNFGKIFQCPNAVIEEKTYE